MKKESVYTTNFVSDGNVSHFLEHLGDCSEEQITDFLKSIYAASQEQIIKGHINRNLAYLYKHLLTPQMLNEELSNALAKILFLNRWSKPICQNQLDMYVVRHITI